MLKVDSVQLEYHGRKVLHDLYLDCRPGCITGLLGRNGSGKSSLLKIIFGTVTPSYKHINANGKVIDKGYADNTIAYLPQQNYLPKQIPIYKLAPMLVDQQAWDEFAGLDIYRHFQNQKPSQLSGGELRKLETLMILYSKANYILLDEPFTHLSPVQAEEIKAMMRKRSAYKGFIITDHQYENILDVSDQVFLLHNGATKLIRDREELITNGYLSHNQLP
jgi:lipopolysaccharide export system ATP-binding protein